MNDMTSLLITAAAAALATGGVVMALTFSAPAYASPSPTADTLVGRPTISLIDDGQIAPVCACHASALKALTTEFNAAQ
ncbi:MAG: hypothetical protein VX203_03295 [Pseudomonadota bacterium]|nr:hypothetical protein [Pseudomonadota bacterium]